MLCENTVLCGIEG